MTNFNSKWSIKKIAYLSLLSIFMVTSCSSDDPTNPIDPVDPIGADRDQFTLALSASPTGETKVYTQTFTDVGSDVTVSYDGVGFEMPSTRTARIFTSTDGKSLYNLDYGGGRIYKYSIDGGQDYTLQSEKDVEFSMGTAYPRWNKASEASASIHHSNSNQAVRVYEGNDNTDPSKFIRSDVPLKVMTVGLDDLSFGAVKDITIPVSATDLQPYTINVNGVDYNHYNYVSRVDAPVIAGDKIYYGMAKGAYSPELDCVGRGCATAIYQNTETLVLDYPELTNPQIISTTIAKGATNGYRTTVAYVDEQNDVYQIISVPNNTYDTHILKISNGAYDETYNFNLSNLLGFNIASRGWFYAGNGIGYVVYANTDLSDTWFSDSNWGVARVDLYNQTVVDLNLPDNLWLAQYQNAVIKDGKFYMAITPTGQDGHVYAFDINSASPDAFTKGATLKNLAEGTYIGIY